MKRWPTKSLEQIAELFGGSTPSRNNPAFWNGEIPWATPTDLPMPDEGISVVSQTKDRITEAGLENSGTVVVPKGTVLFSSRATIGKVAVADMPLTTNQGFANFVPRSEISSRFLAYTLWHRREDIARLSGSTTFKEVSRSTLRKYEIPVPPLAEQERIAKLLDEANELRKLRAHADRRTAEFIPALFHKMFGDPLENPKRWPIKPVASFVEHFQGGRSLTPAEANEVNGPYRVLKISAVTCGEFRPDENKPVSAKYQPPADHFVRTSDLLFSRANTTELVAATSYVFETPPNLLLPDKLWRFVWKQPQIVDPLFVWWLFQTSSIRAELGRRASGTGGSMKNISQPKVMSLEVPVPPLPLQKEFAERVKEIRELETAQAHSRARLNALFASLLDRAFKGEL